MTRLQLLIFVENFDYHIKLKVFYNEKYLLNYNKIIKTFRSKFCDLNHLIRNLNCRIRISFNFIWYNSFSIILYSARLGHLVTKE